MSPAEVQAISALRTFTLVVVLVAAVVLTVDALWLSPRRDRRRREREQILDYVERHYGNPPRWQR